MWGRASALQPGFCPAPRCCTYRRVQPLRQDAPHKLADRARGDTPIFQDLRELVDGIGGRPTGSDACTRAVDWAAKKFRDIGIQNVTVEPFTAPNMWLGVSAEASAVAPVKFNLRIASAPMSPSTKAPIEAKLVDVGDATPAAFAKLGPAVKGAIVLVHSAEMKTFDDLFAEYFRNIGLIEAAKKYQPAAMLLESTRPRGLLYRHPISLDTNYAPVPTAIVSREHAERLARLAEKGEVRVRLAMTNRTAASYESRNVIAEIRGREKPDEIVLVGAHLDSWDLGTGAEDNGVNVALVLDLARAFHDLHITPRRTLRFALFTGEEQGMLGSEAYVARHKSELDKFTAVVIFDTGSGHLSGFYLNGREELRAPINHAIGAVDGLKATDHLIDALDGTDNFDFLISGVPNLVGIQDPIPYLPDYHAESDTFDRVNQKEEKITEAVAATLLWGLAENPERPAGRQARAQVEKLLQDTKLDEQMKAFGQWDEFQSHKRGWF
ncbi:MAG TPA: M20/M25/M40 family metallo-hydrolase [Bryobacteraceae bacterium]|nr:M20/M25/M40 family metallo-hydrolase [Bryobacteraceae bacterium]